MTKIKIQIGKDSFPVTFLCEKYTEKEKSLTLFGKSLLENNGKNSTWTFYASDDCHWWIL